MRLEKLPGWVADNAASIREEVAPYLCMTMSERWEATRRCCRAAAAMLGFQRDPGRAREYRDPLPASTRRALERRRRSMATP